MSGEEKRITLTETELKALMSSTVVDTLTKLGIDSAQPLETQKDMAHLRKSRESVDAIKKKAWLSAVGFIVLLVCGAVVRFISGE